MPRQLLRTRLRSLFWRRSPEQEVDDELAQHLALTARRLEQAGLSPEAARAAALQRFGDLNQVRAECRVLAHEYEDDMRRRETFQELRQDASYGLRVLRRTPLFTTIALLTLAIGIGASTAIFSVVHAVLLRALPYREADRTVVIWNGYTQAGGRSHTAIAPPEFADVREQTQVFDAVAAVGRQTANLTGSCGGSSACEPERVAGYAVSPDLFRLLGTASPVVGRGFVDGDGAEGAEPVVLLSHALWMRRFAGDSSLVGRTIDVSGRLRTVIGVMPPEVRFPDAPLDFLRERGDLWIPHAWERNRSEERGNQYLGMIARLRPRASLAQAQRDLEAIGARFRAEWPDRYARADLRWGLDAFPLREHMIGEARSAILVVAGAVGLLLLLACANVAHLTLARGTVRQRELAVRTALGARRGRLVRQLLTESVLLALGGSVLGLLTAVVGVRLLVVLDPGNIPHLDTARVDGVVLLFTLGVALAAGLLIGLLPAMRQSQVRPSERLQDGARGAATGHPRRRLRSVLVVAEVAMALVILVGAGLLARSFIALQRVDTGFDSRDVLTVQLALPRARYDSASKIVAFHARVREQLATIPGVAAVGGADPLPMSGSGWSGSMYVEDLRVPPEQAEQHAEYAVALPGYFRAMGIPLLEGRDFTDADRRGAPLTVIVDERLAAKYWPGQSAIGKRINPNRAQGTWATIVGVVKHVYNAGPRQEGEPQIYVSFLEHIQHPLTYVLRTGGDPLSVVRAVRRAIASVDPELPVARMATMADLESRALARDRFNALVLSVFALTALVLAAIGLYGVMAYLVNQRTAEIGVRLALGGRPYDVVRLVIGEGMAMALTGIVLGVAVSLALSNVLAGLLYGVAPIDPLTYTAIAAVLALVALLASAIPARRAARVDPVAAHR
ncbi:MAG TPA: ABC transporter permease [Gemmatimonadaceae bacterium]|nr:ABC transporter permease [Gemmatimonadaceae bacterium]